MAVAQAKLMKKKSILKVTKMACLQLLQLFRTDSQTLETIPARKNNLSFALSSLLAVRAIYQQNDKLTIWTASVQQRVSKRRTSNAAPARTTGWKTSSSSSLYSCSKRKKGREMDKWKSIANKRC